MSIKAKIDPVVGHEWDEDAGTYWDDKAGLASLFRQKMKLGG